MKTLTDVITTRISFHLFHPSYIDLHCGCISLSSKLWEHQTDAMLRRRSTHAHTHTRARTYTTLYTRPFLQIPLPLPFILQLASLRRRQQDAHRTAGSSAKSAEDTYRHLEHARVVTEGACLTPLLLSLFLFLSSSLSSSLSLLLSLSSIPCRRGADGVRFIVSCGFGRVCVHLVV